MRIARRHRRILVHFALFAIALFAGCNPARNNGDGAASGAGKAAKTGGSANAPYKLAFTIDGKDTPLKKFDSPNSVAAGAGFIYVSDRGYSYVHIFTDAGEYDGRIGCGFKVDDYTKNDDELKESNRSADEKLSPELLQQIAINGFFRPEDLYFESGHVFLLNSYFSSITSDPVMQPSIFEFTAGGQFYRQKKLAKVISPGFLAVDSRQNFAISDIAVDEIWIGDSNATDKYVNKRLMIGTRSYFSTLIDARGDPKKFDAIKKQTSNTGIGRDAFEGIGGLAAYTPTIGGESRPEETKLLACDTGNDRIKVLDFSGKLYSVIEGTKGGKTYFKQPRDIAFLPDGRAAIIDAANNSIVLMHPDFTFEQGFGGDLLKDPKSVCSDMDGRIIVADSELASVLVFEQKS